MKFLLANLDRPALGPTYSDEYIERWAPVYLANPALRLLGCPFSRFLENPAEWLRFAGNPVRKAAPAPQCTRRAEAAIAEAERVEGHGENGRLVQKTRHHKHPRGRGRDFIQLRDA